MSYRHYDIDDAGPDTRTPAEKQRQYEEFRAAWTNATDLFHRQAAEGWTEERAWGERLPDVRKGRLWTSPEELAAYLEGEWRFWGRNAPTPEDRKVIARTAREMWVGRVSERVVPLAPVVPLVAPTAGIQFAVCAFTPCRRTFDRSTGCFGAFCSASCLTAEVEQPGMFVSPVPLCSDDEEARLA